MEDIILKNIDFKYPATEKKVLNGLNLSVNKGELCLVIGESGVGKSTLLKLLKKEIAPYGDFSGEIIINSTVGYVSQNVEENIVCDKVRAEMSFALTNRGVSAKESELIVSETASYFNLESKLDSEISSLSGGEKQMVNLASVMVMKPQILVLDEPCSQLDPVSASKFIEAVKRLVRDFAITVIISEHSSDNLFYDADSIVLLENGRASFKLPPFEAANTLRQDCSKMLGCVPTYMRLFENAKSVIECRRIIESKNIKPLETNDSFKDRAMKIRNLSYSYVKGDRVIDSLSLDIYSAKINTILGPNASGKSTLLKLMSGVYKPHSGRVKTDLSVSMLCQNPYDLFTKDTCLLETEFSDITRFLEIDDIKEQHPYDLSGGQAQRLALSKVIQTGADIILLDEPTKGLDCVLKDKLEEILLELCKRGKTIVMVTHDIEFAGRCSHMVSFISRGRIVNTAPRREFFSNLTYYTTSIAKITKGLVDNIVSYDDLVKAGGFDE